MSQITRRQLAVGAAWSTPIIVASAAVPARALSCESWQKYDLLYGQGIWSQNPPGQQQTVRLRVQAQPGTPPPENACAQPVDEPVRLLITVLRKRGAGSAQRRWEASSAYGDLVKTVDVADSSQHPVDSEDYQWSLKVIPSQVYALPGHGFEITLSAQAHARITNGIYASSNTGMALTITPV